MVNIEEIQNSKYGCAIMFTVLFGLGALTTVSSETFFLVLKIAIGGGIILAVLAEFGILVPVPNKSKPDDENENE